MKMTFDQQTTVPDSMQNTFSVYGHLVSMYIIDSCPGLFRLNYSSLSESQIRKKRFLIRLDLYRRYGMLTY